MDKKELRRTIRERKRAMTEEEIVSRSEKLGALFAFVILSSFDFLDKYSCLLFFYAIPANAIVLLSLRSAWHDFRWNQALISAIVWGSLLSMYVTLKAVMGIYFWKIFLLGIPGQIAIFLWFRMFRSSDTKKENTNG